MTLRFSDTSLDPYLRFFAPKMSPYTTAVADGTIRVVGELADIDHLLVEATVDKLQLKLFDYPAANEGPIQLALNQHVVEVKRFRLVGESTALELSGNVGLHDNRIALDASGDANLGDPAGVLPRHPQLRATPRCTRRCAGRSTTRCSPATRRSPTAASGTSRCRTACRTSTARLDFDAQGIRIVDAVAQLGGGPVKFGGRIGPRTATRSATIDLTADGEQMNLRYPGGLPLDDRRGADAARQPVVARARRQRDDPRRRLHASASSRTSTSSRSPPAAAGLPAAVAGDARAAGALRHQGPGARHAAPREQPGAHGRARRPDA